MGCFSDDALQVPTLLGVVASVSTPLPTRTQRLPTLLAQQCWELFPFAPNFTSTVNSCVKSYAASTFFIRADGRPIRAMTYAVSKISGFVVTKPKFPLRLFNLHQSTATNVEAVSNLQNRRTRVC